MTNANPYLLEPRLWFAMLCEGLQSDERGRLNFQRVFNQVAYLTPPESDGVSPHGYLNGVLVVGLEGGLGDFTAEVDLCNADGHVVWARDEPWAFNLGTKAAAVLAHPIQRWLREQGPYYFRVRVHPGDREHQIHFEVTASPGPAEVAEPSSEQPPDVGTAS